MTELDAIIIGAGQAGPPLANRLTRAGMKVAIIERKLFGGTCVNTGCIPTKTLVASAYAAHMARRGANYGVVLDHGVQIDMPRVKARADLVSGNSRASVEKWLRGMSGCTVIQGHARFEASDTVRIGAQILKAPRIFINVGGRAVVPEMPGVHDVPFLVNSTILGLDRVPRHLVVVGGSYVGLEFAQMYRRFGAEVTVIEKAPKLLGREDDEAARSRSSAYLTDAQVGVEQRIGRGRPGQDDDDRRDDDQQGDVAQVDPFPVSGVEQREEQPGHRQQGDADPLQLDP